MFQARIMDGKTNKRIQLKTIEAQMMDAQSIDGKPTKTNPIKMFEARIMDGCKPRESN